MVVDKLENILKIFYDPCTTQDHLLLPLAQPVCLRVIGIVALQQLLPFSSRFKGPHGCHGRGKTSGNILFQVNEVR